MSRLEQIEAILPELSESELARLRLLLSPRDPEGRLRHRLSPEEKLKVLHELQVSLNLDDEKIRKWENDVNEGW